MTAVHKQLKLGVCYYPEHWDKTLWKEDLARMRQIGIEYVRLAEFAWTLMQPTPNRYDFSWLDEVLDMIEKAGLKAILCTPTATPPVWLTEKEPGILPYDEEGRRRNFGSRRHYTFSSPAYLDHSREIAGEMARRYGKHPVVAAWQTDNEHGCHESTRSYGPEDLRAFRRFLTAKYGDIQTLNRAWGNVFWNQTYDNFEQILLPNRTVAQANPSHWLDFYRFSSSQVVAFNAAQVRILREHAEDVPITHNMMGFSNEFDHYSVGEDLDIASWDNYPLGYLEDMYWDDEDKHRYSCTGHPDISAFFHDLYRFVGRGNLWVMEQQPGPVNWAAHNPAPLAGIIRFWTWQAFAHGADMVSYFRWRQVPFGTEQMHTALLLPNSEPAPAYAEVARIAEEKKRLPSLQTSPAKVALLFDYEAAWITELEAQSANYRYLEQVLNWYGSLRRYGLNADVVSPDAPLESYALVLAPCLPVISATLTDKLQRSDAYFLWGPRSGGKTENFHIPAELPPGNLQKLVPLKVETVSTLRGRLATPAAADAMYCLSGDGVFGPWTGGIWHERVRTDLKPLAQTGAGDGILYANRKHHYLCSCLDAVSIRKLIGYLLNKAGVPVTELPPGVRLCRTQEADFYFNFGRDDYSLPKNGEHLLAETGKPGRGKIAGGEYAALKRD